MLKQNADEKYYISVICDLTVKVNCLEKENDRLKSRINALVSINNSLKRHLNNIYFASRNMEDNLKRINNGLIGLDLRPSKPESYGDKDDKIEACKDNKSIYRSCADHVSEIYDIKKFVDKIDDNIIIAAFKYFEEEGRCNNCESQMCDGSVECIKSCNKFRKWLAED